MGAGVRVEYPRSTWLCASASRSRDSESRGKNVFRSGSILSSSSSVPRGVSVAVGVNSQTGEHAPFRAASWRPAHLSAEAGSLSLLETAEDVPTRRRCAISGGNLQVAIGDVAPVSGGPSRHRLLLRARQRVDVRR